MKDALKSAMRAIAPRTLLDIAKEAHNLSVDRRAAYVKRRLRRMVGAVRPESLPHPARSVLFVCHGNIMRSAAAAGFLREELRAAGISNVTVGSAGTHAHIGRPADARAQDAARELGLSLSEHSATRLTRKLVADYDVIFAMDDLNYVNILKTYPESRTKLMLLGGMRPSGSYPAHEIADPYMASSAEINATVSAIKRYVRALAHALVAQSAPPAPAESPATEPHRG
jgi:protein-tyrosine-phosphatase